MSFLNSVQIPQVFLIGPFALNKKVIEQRMILPLSGVYVLSRYGSTAHYVGRSDTNVRAKLLSHVGSTYSSYGFGSQLIDYLFPEYTEFWYDYAILSRDAYRKECTLYHQYGEASSLDNLIHPQRPLGDFWGCPVCRRDSWFS